MFFYHSIKEVLPFLQPFRRKVNGGVLDYETSGGSAQVESSVFLVGTGARGLVVDENPQNAGT